MTFWDPYSNEIMGPSSDRATLSLVRTRLEYFLLMVYFSNIYVAWSKLIANSLNKLE